MTMGEAVTGDYTDPQEKFKVAIVFAINVLLFLTGSGHKATRRKKFSCDT